MPGALIVSERLRRKFAADARALDLGELSSRIEQTKHTCLGIRNLLEEPTAPIESGAAACRVAHSDEAIRPVINKRHLVTGAIGPRGLDPSGAVHILENATVSF